MVVVAVELEAQLQILVMLEVLVVVEDTTLGQAVQQLLQVKVIMVLMEQVLLVVVEVEVQAELGLLVIMVVQFWPIVLQALLLIMQEAVAVVYLDLLGHKAILMVEVAVVTMMDMEVQPQVKKVWLSLDI